MKTYSITLIMALLSIACQDTQKIRQSANEIAVVKAAKIRNNDSVTLDRISNLKNVLATSQTAAITADITEVKPVEEVLGIQPDVAVIVEHFILDKADPVTKNTTRCRITRVISEAYGLSEFKDAKGSYVDYDKMLPIIKKSISWQRVGSATDQKAVDRAMKHTNAGGLAIAVDTAVPYGHIVQLLSGDAITSGSWGMQLPKVLSLSNHHPERSFCDKSLAYAFKKDAAVEIYIEKKY